MAYRQKAWQLQAEVHTHTHTEENVGMVELTLNQEGRLHTGYRDRWVSPSPMKWLSHAAILVWSVWRDAVRNSWMKPTVPTVLVLLLITCRLKHIANLLLSPMVKEFWKSVNSWWSYRLSARVKYLFFYSRGILNFTLAVPLAPWYPQYLHLPRTTLRQ